MSLEAAGAYYRRNRWSYELGRWDDYLSGAEEVLINLDSNLCWEVQKAECGGLRSSGHNEAMLNDFKFPRTK